MNLLMISIGDNILTDPIGDSLERQLEYAKYIGYINMIVYSTNKNLTPKHYTNLSIYPTNSKNMLTFIHDTLNISKNILQQKHIDVITTQDPFGTALAGYFLKKKYNIPLHIQNHSSFINNKKWIQERPILFNIFNKIAHFTIKKANRLRVVNNEEKEKYINYLKINPNKIDVAPVPIKTDFWQTPPTKQEIKQFKQKYNINDNLPIISYAGREAKVKNLPLLYRITSKIQNINFLLAGDIKNPPNHAVYLGKLSHKELKIMYYISNIYLNTSNYEGFGLVISDAQACGIPVISTPTAGAKDIIENNKSGFLVDDEKTFIKKINFLLNNPKEQQKMGTYAKNMIQKKFNYQKMFDKIILSIKNTL